MFNVLLVVKHALKIDVIYVLKISFTLKENVLLDVQLELFLMPVLENVEVVNITVLIVNLRIFVKNVNLIYI